MHVSPPSRSCFPQASQRLQHDIFRSEIQGDGVLEVLRLLANGYAIGEIAKQLQVSIKTISTYRSRLLEKLNAKSTVDLIRFAVMEDVSE